MMEYSLRRSLMLSAVMIGLFSCSLGSLHASEEVYGFSSDGGTSSESYLGVDTRDITPDRLATLQLKEEKGVEITMVDQDAPAGKAGLKEQDVLLQVNGTEVESVEQLRRLIHEIPAGRVISLGLSRNGQPMTLKAQLAERKKGFAMVWPQSGNLRIAIPPIPPIPAMPEMDIPVSIVVVHSSTRSGLMVENLTPQLGEFFGVKGGQGILVRSVEKGSRAEKAGFHAGDVIVQVNGEKINDSGDFSHALNSRNEHTAVVSVLRDRKQMNLTLTLPDHGPTGNKTDESTNIPIGDARTEMEMIRAQSELARLQPEIESAQKDVLMHALDIKGLEQQVNRATRAAEKEQRKRLQEDERIQRTFRNQADI